jgi:hypothetical protein
VHKGDGEYEAAVRLTLALLHEAAQRDENDQAAFVTYKQLSEHLAEHDVDLPYYGGLMPDALADASRREAAEGRGLISALVVQQDIWTPSVGFYRFARSEFDRTGDDERIWVAECQRIRREHRDMPD